MNRGGKMAIVKDIRRIYKDNLSSSQTVLDYAICKNGLSLWTYAAGDVEREKGSKQNLLFESKELRELHMIISNYLNQNE